MELLKPAWPAPDNIFAGVTTRNGGVSKAPYDTLNLATHVGEPEAITIQNRGILNSFVAGSCNVPETSLHWCWLEQTHSNIAINAKAYQRNTAADACWSSQPSQVCVVLTADCLPILLADRNGRVVAAIHAGWRGLANGVIQNCVASLCAAIDSLNAIDLLAWLGPAIGPNAYEVGSDVYHEFINTEGSTEGCAEDQAESQAARKQAFTPLPEPTSTKYWCAPYQLATATLNDCGIKQIYGGGFCTTSQAEQFYSYRRDGKTGRMASFITLLHS